MRKIGQKTSGTILFFNHNQEIERSILRIGGHHAGRPIGPHKGAVRRMVTLLKMFDNTKGAIAVFAPPLDEAGNSVKAQEVIEYVASKLNYNLYSPASVGWK